MDAPLLDASVEEQSASAPAPQGFTVPAVQGFERSNSLIDTGLMATLLRIRLPKLDATVEVKNKRVVIVAALGLLASILQNEVCAPSLDLARLHVAFWSSCGAYLFSLSFSCLTHRSCVRAVCAAAVVHEHVQL